MKLVAVVVPIYKSYLSFEDRISLDQTYKILSKYPIVIIHPEGLDMSLIKKDYPKVTFKAFDAPFFSSIEGYNKLMLSEVFYRAFADYSYILITQLDAYVFKDELKEWCSKGYDYIGAPWLQSQICRLPIINQIIKYIAFVKRFCGIRSKYFRYGKVGNGGFSLRKVHSHIKVIQEQSDTVRLYSEIKNRKHLFNEDTFWAMEPKHFKYPSTYEAMLFSYNKYPEVSYKLTNKATPFGCHGWTKRKYRKFWCKKSEKPSMPNY